MSVRLLNDTFQLWPALLVISGSDPGLRVGSYCTTKNGGSGLVLGLTNRSNGTIKVKWDETDETVSDPQTSNLVPAAIPKFDLEKFGQFAPEVIQHLARIVNLEVDGMGSRFATPRGTPRGSTKTTPKVSAINASQSFQAGTPITVQSQDLSERHLARKFAAQHLQSAALRTIMMIFSMSHIDEIIDSKPIRMVLSDLIAQSAKPSSLEVGVPLGDLIRAGNVMLSSAIGIASPWEASGNFSDDSLNTSDDDAGLTDDDDDDDDYMTEAEGNEDDTSGLPPGSDQILI